MNLTDVHNPRACLSCYDAQIDWAAIRSAWPKSLALYRSLRRLFLELSEDPSKLVFTLLKELLSIDCQLQIPSQLLKMYVPWYEHFTDEELVRNVTTDKDFFIGK